jgi:hypothetical protein
MIMIKTYLSLISLLAINILLSSCVTINIYFPAAAAEKVADKIIEEVWQTDEEADTEETDKNNP